MCIESITIFIYHKILFVSRELFEKYQYVAVMQSCEEVSNMFFGRITLFRVVTAALDGADSCKAAGWTLVAISSLRIQAHRTFVSHRLRKSRAQRSNGNYSGEFPRGDRCSIELGSYSRSCRCRTVWKWRCCKLSCYMVHCIIKAI